MNFTHSFSAIKQYQQCGRQYHEVRILRNFKSSPTEATMYGEAVHKAFERHIRDGEPLPEAFARYSKFVEPVCKFSGDIFVEQKMGLRRDFTPCGFFDKDVWFRGVPDFLCINRETGVARVGDWKGLALDTKIPTPTGFTTMRDIKEGDFVFDATGTPTKVVGKSQVKLIRCYRVRFSDNTEVICDEEHLWKLDDGSVVNVRDLMGSRTARQRVNVPRIPVAEPLALPDVELPIDPYVFGLWLADGSRGSGEISKPDSFVWEEIQRRGYAVDMSTGGSGACPTRTVKGLRTQMRTSGLLDADKHIPGMYLRAGYQQRLDLLRGLMDGDGNANPTRKQAVFTTTSKSLSDGVMELLCSLGQRPLQSVTRQAGFGVQTIAYPVSFRPVGVNPFYLPRKAARIDPSWGPGDSTFRRAVSVEEIPIVPTQCIAVESPDHTFLCTERMVPTHNTGKSSRFADTSQLELMGAMVMMHHPEVQKIKGALLFIVAGDVIRANYTREQLPDILSKWAGYANQIESATVWNPKPSGLCRGFCPVKTCEYSNA